MLSTHVIALTPANRKPDPQMLAGVDKIRVRRNDLMHKGHFAIPRLEIFAMIRTAQLYVDYLAGLAAG